MGLIELLAPARCLGCGARAAPPWCVTCAGLADSLAVGAACDRCGSLQRDDGGEHPCWPLIVPILTTVVAFRYTGVVARTIAVSKARSAWAGWDVLGGRLAAAVERAGIADVDVVTWIPADQKRARRRGADHAALLAAPVARHLNRPLARLLEAAGPRPDQVRLPAARRRALSAAAYSARGRLDRQRIVVVDDVLTTGATSRVAASALARVGAAPVRLAVLARAGGHRLDAAVS
jgi:predicted amidophosphoribosyltransferase